jgi:hypothetical protein
MTGVGKGRSWHDPKDGTECTSKSNPYICIYIQKYPEGYRLMHHFWGKSGDKVLKANILSMDNAKDALRDYISTHEEEVLNR